MFERFTERARRVVVLAQTEARVLNHTYIGTEHLLLGLIHDGEGVAANALESLGVELVAVREMVLEMVGQGDNPPTGHIPFTPHAKKVLEMSLREALEMGHRYIGTEHILLGLVREGEGVAAQVLRKQGVGLKPVRAKVAELLAAGQGHPEGEPHVGLRPERLAAAARPSPDVPELPPTCPTCRADLTVSARSRFGTVAEQGGERTAEVIWLFCGACGRLLAAKLPDEKA